MLKITHHDRMTVTSTVIRMIMKMAKVRQGDAQWQTVTDSKRNRHTGQGIAADSTQ